MEVDKARKLPVAVAPARRRLLNLGFLGAFPPGRRDSLANGGPVFEPPLAPKALGLAFQCVLVTTASILTAALDVLPP